MRSHHATTSWDELGHNLGHHDQQLSTKAPALSIYFSLDCCCSCANLVPACWRLRLRAQNIKRWSYLRPPSRPVACSFFQAVVLRGLFIEVRGLRKTLSGKTLRQKDAAYAGPVLVASKAVTTEGTCMRLQLQKARQNRSPVPIASSLQSWVWLKSWAPYT